MDSFALPVLAVLSVVAAAQQAWIYKTGSEQNSPSNRNVGFSAFQRNYLVVFLIMMASDWLQGPYVYALYESYGFTVKQIGQLFVFGFAASGVFGVVAGAFADAFGRKFSCLVFAVFYIGSCITKHFNVFFILLLGRLLAGVATSLLFSSFDAWMVAEHHKRQFPADGLQETFSRATFGNGIVAILAGLLASGAVHMWGPVAPFDFAIVFLAAGFALILYTWPENFGDRKAALKVSEDSLGEAIMRSYNTVQSAVRKDSDVLLCGVLQSTFEAAMYIFVFYWTPSLPHGVNHGLVFACFMVGVMIGSALCTEAHRLGISNQTFLFRAYVAGACALFATAVDYSPHLKLVGFVAFEVVVGIHFSAFYTIRASVVPDNCRALVLNLYRLPLNLIVVIACLVADLLSITVVFVSCAILVAVAAFCAFMLRHHNPKEECHEEAMELGRPEEEVETAVGA